MRWGVCVRCSAWDEVHKFFPLLFQCIGQGMFTLLNLILIVEDYSGARLLASRSMYTWMDLSTPSSFFWSSPQDF